MMTMNDSIKHHDHDEGLRKHKEEAAQKKESIRKMLDHKIQATMRQKRVDKIAETKIGAGIREFFDEAIKKKA